MIISKNDNDNNNNNYDYSYDACYEGIEEK